MIEVTVSPARIPAGATADLEIRLKNSGQDACLNIIFTIKLPVGIIRLRGPETIMVSKLPRASRSRRRSASGRTELDATG